MFDTILLLSQALAVALIGGWLTLGVRDNILHPLVNETYTRQVFEMSRMREMYPEEFAAVAHRAIHDRAMQRRAFRAVVAAEALAALVLWTGALALVASCAGIGSASGARAIALLGAALFTGIWAMFLIVGNHFCYWFCHEGAQNTHFQMTLWGLGTMILLAA
jgi:predicted small integral membrane protein